MITGLIGPNGVRRPRCFTPARSDPKVVPLDGVSMSLVVVDEIFASLQILAGSGVPLLLVEQYV